MTEPDKPAEQPLTLKKLTDALAEMLGPPTKSQAPPASGPAPTDASTSSDADVGCAINPRTILEALLFVGRPGGEGLRVEQVADLIRDVEPAEIDEAVNDLNAHYAAEGAPYTIIQDESGLRLSLTPEFQRARRRLSGQSREARLSQAAVEVLALVAYNQPIPGTEISRLRGRPCNHLLTHLVRRQLLRIERASERPRTPMYSTTPRFLALFRLADINELPQTQELEQ